MNKYTIEYKLECYHCGSNNHLFHCSNQSGPELDILCIDCVEQYEIEQDDEENDTELYPTDFI